MHNRMKAFAYLATCLAAAALSGCIAHQTEAPPLSGPSDLALSMSVTASPESINQDGASQSRITITAMGPDGRAKASLPIRVDMALDGVAQDFGTLSARSVVTGSDGKAFVTYTAPPSPVGGITGTCKSVPGTCVEIVATPSDSGTGSFETAHPVYVTIRLVPPGIILPPAGTPTASFTMTPTPVTQGPAVTFDASASSPGTGASTITTYSWSFGDGGSAVGKTATHSFSSAATFNVTLTVTNDRGLSASSSQSVSVGGIAVPSANFVFSPGSPQVNQAIVFNADVSTAAPGHSLTTFNWNFGDGSTASGLVVSHTFTSGGTFVVVLSVLDDTGQKATTSRSVVVAGGAGGGAAAPTAAFVFSPTSPQINQTIFFDATTSRAAAGHSIVSYAWNFGDGQSATTAVPTTSHSYAAAATYNVVMTVTDDVGQVNSATQQIGVSGGAGSLSADFTFSPTNPVSGSLISFNANLSSPLGSITAFDWDFGDTTIVNNGGMTINHSYNTPVNATFTVRLTVHDSAGRTATTTKTVSVVAGADPIADFTISPNPATPGAPGVNFNGSASVDGSGNPAGITNYQWNFGDGSPIATGNPVNHVYATKGTYTITLTVTQTNGRTNSTSHTLLVQ
jgi:PKD repeat protein